MFWRPRLTMRPMLLPSFDAREKLLDGFAALGGQVGWEAFIANPIVTPEPKFFPDRWSPDARGARQLARRLLTYLELGYDVAMTVETPEDDGVVAWFDGL